MPSPNDIVKVYNPDEKDFEFRFGGQDFLLRASESRLMQRYLAEHCCKHLTDRILTERGVSTANQEERNKLIPQIIVTTVEDYATPLKKTEGEKIKEEYRRMNPPVSSPFSSSANSFPQSGATPTPTSANTSELLGYDKFDEPAPNYSQWGFYDLRREAVHRKIYKPQLTRKGLIRKLTEDDQERYPDR